ncbi:MAG TPA: hypothetical protein VK911_01045 [Vicinamibacterales bacterium]|nr:hypothetical protein [Vicinamibacterales bacterium]
MRTGTGIGTGIDEQSDLDSFMERVLARRDEAWRTLHDYILGERERFQILGPGGVPLHGLRREYTWYVREGYLIRSPVRFNGVTLSDAERREYEGKWLEQEKERERRARERSEKAESGAEQEKTRVTVSPGGVKVTKEPEEAEGTAARGTDVHDDPSPQEFVDQRGEPRFLSEAYFLRFKFEPGNYYLAGREQLDGREVLRIEYYPSRLFGDERGTGRDEARGRSERDKSRDKSRGQDRERDKSRGQDRERERDQDRNIDRQLNKTSLVTLWVDPAEHQIVRYTFDNMDFGFLPGRWLVRVDDTTASMTMGRVLDGVWLPSRISMAAGLSLAHGGYRFEYAREFFDYRKAEVGARIRGYVPR